MCNKFGENVNDKKTIMLNDLQIAWVNDVRHLGNHINKSLSDKLDCQHKLSTFIGSVNKLNPILKIYSMMLLLDCSNPIVVHSMALKHGALIHQTINAFVYHGTKVFETF